MSESEPVGYQKSTSSGVSIAWKTGVGFFSSGSILSVTEGLPNDTPVTNGFEVGWHFKRVRDGHGREVGRLSFSYLQARPEEKVTPQDLPIPNSLRTLLDFELTRKATMHIMSTGWSWDMDRPVYRSGHVTFISPSFKIGAGMARSNIEIVNNGHRREQSRNDLFVLGAVGGEVAALQLRRVIVSLDGAIAVYAGSLIGMAGEALLKIQYKL